MVAQADGFDTCPADTGGGHIRGTMLRFIDWKYFAGRGRKELDPTNKLFVATDLKAVWVKWADGRIVDQADRTRTGEYPTRDDLPDQDKTQWKCNAAGEAQDPWKDTRYLGLLDHSTAAIYTFTTSTAGGRRAIADLRDQTLRMRSFRGNLVFPIVRLGGEEMPTRFAVKSKPLFVVTDWVVRGAPQTSAAATPLISAEPVALMPLKASP
jgi:hypothetical protein